MIHTFKMYFPISYKDVEQLQKRLGIIYTELNKAFEGKYSGVTMSISCKGRGNWILSMVVDAIMLLNNPQILEKDYPLLEKRIKKILWNVLGHSFCYNDHVLQRMDYRFDVIIQNKDTRLLLLKLYNKLTRSYHFQKKYLGKVNENGIYIPFETTVYHSSKSVEAVVYLKEEERIAKNKTVEDYEKSVVRYEVRLKENHTYYMERKTDSLKRLRKLKEYLKYDLYREYFHKYMSHIYHPGKFYKLDGVRDVLKVSSLTINNKKKIIDFLKTVSSYDLDTPLKNMTKSTRNKRLQTLNSLKVNPILIPKNYRKAPPSLENPLDRFPWKKEQ